MSVEFIDLLTNEPVEGVGVARDPEPSPAPRLPRRRDRKPYGRNRRRAGMIHAYDGPNGSGKSLAMMHDTLPTLDGIKWVCRVPDHRHTLAGIYEGERTVLATLRILDPETGLQHPRAVLMVDFVQLLTAEHCDVLLDEVMGVASSGDHGGLPGEVKILLQKLRHFDITLRWTSPRFGAGHLDLRSVTKVVTSCRGFFPDRRNKDLAWAPNRMFSWRSFSTDDYDGEAPSRTERKKRATVVAWFWGPKSRAFASYDTLGVVSSLRKSLPSGTCSVCGGRRPVPKCSCDDH